MRQRSASLPCTETGHLAHCGARALRRRCCRGRWSPRSAGQGRRPGDGPPLSWLRCVQTLPRGLVAIMRRRHHRLRQHRPWRACQVYEGAGAYGREVAGCPVIQDRSGHFLRDRHGLRGTQTARSGGGRDHRDLRSGAGRVERHPIGEGDGCAGHCPRHQLGTPRPRPEVRRRRSRRPDGERCRRGDPRIDPWGRGAKDARLQLESGGAAGCGPVGQDLGHRLFRRRTRRGDIRCVERPSAPSGDAGGILDLQQERSGGLRRIHRRSENRRRCAVYARVHARSGRRRL